MMAEDNQNSSDVESQPGHAAPEHDQASHERETSRKKRWRQGAVIALILTVLCIIGASVSVAIRGDGGTMMQVSASNSTGGTAPAPIFLDVLDEKWLHAHNIRREEWHTRYGKTYVPLKWSNVLEAQATAYAQDMLSTCGDVSVLGNTEYGENLAWNVGTGSWGSFREPEDILIRWVDNQADWGRPNNAHLTQALWRATEYVGCGVASKSWNDGMCRTQVCRYARPGNCNMTAYQSNQGDQKWLEPMLKDDSPCLPACPPDGDC